MAFPSGENVSRMTEEESSGEADGFSNLVTKGKIWSGMLARNWCLRVVPRR